MGGVLCWGGVECWRIALATFLPPPGERGVFFVFLFGSL